MLTEKSLMNPVLHTDSYKLSHKSFEPENTQMIYSNFTARGSKYFEAQYPNFNGKVVVFGMTIVLARVFKQYWEEGFFKRPKEEVMKEIEEVLSPYLGMDSEKLQHFAELHDLGYLPLKIKALPEGSLCKTGIPLYTFENTHEKFSWLTNYIESSFSNEAWKLISVATIAKEFRILANTYYELTASSFEKKPFSFHDFSFRGHDSTWSAAATGVAHLLAFNGTDNVPAVTMARTLLKAPPSVASSVPASEHSVTTLGINLYDSEDKALGEYLALEQVLTKQFPTGIVSYVSDSYDYWRLLTEILPRLKSTIEKRQGTLTLRPDSGNPVDIVVGTSRHVVELETLDHLREIMLFSGAKNDNLYTVKGTDKYVKLTRHLFSERESNGILEISEHLASLESMIESPYLAEIEVDTNSPEWKGSIEVLWELFGGTVNEKGYKELPPYIGLIYGDGITYKRATDIFQGLAAKGFAASNIIFGIGSYSMYSSTSRDSLSIAIKATKAIVDGKEISLYKDPKTDISSKKSAKGYLKVIKDEQGEYQLLEDVTLQEAEEGELKTVFLNGTIVGEESFDGIQQRFLKDLADQVL